ncbi:competence protein [Bacillus sp. HNG]|uniref:competence protein ComK n=1 Tax=Bacillus sp. HNG TaxID=2293325 RepID=UPI000E2EB6A5|nr:competence protein ComK [Bacillus sp. HNG]RFB18343.1 competence protein [Bacillus sp. HNG]
MEVKNSNYLVEYEINPDTMAVLPIEMGNHTCSRVLEVEGEYVVAMKPTEIVDRSCRYFGSSLKGRQEGTREIMGVTHKAPIIVEASNKIFLFPTASPTKQECAWLSHHYVSDCKFSLHEETTVIFTNKQAIQLQISKGSFQNQLHRTAQLRTIVTNRMDKPNKRINFVINPQINDSLPNKSDI